MVRLLVRRLGIDGADFLVVGAALHPIDKLQHVFFHGVPILTVLMVIELRRGRRELRGCALP
jgi:hypothetical protein